MLPVRHVGLVVKLIVEVAIKWTMDNGNGDISRKQNENGHSQGKCKKKELLI
jgi:hypothetical protein